MWSPADLETAISMRKDGYSSALIAEKLGTTRNAVIGKLHRAGVPGGDVIQVQESKAVQSGAINVVREKPY